MTPMPRATTIQEWRPAQAAAGWGLAQLQPDEDFLVREHNHGPPDSDFVSMTWAAAQVLHLPLQDFLLLLHQ